MLCVPALIIVLVSIITVLFDYQIYNGFIPIIVISDIFILLLLIALVQWFCSKQATGVAWLTAFSITAFVFYGLYLWRTNNPEFMKFIEDEKNKVAQKSK